MPLRRILRREYRSRAVEWAIIYTLYLFVATGLIISSAITLKYGNDFFADAATNPDITEYAGGASTGTCEDRESVPPAQLAHERRDALIESGVVSSIGLASGIIALVLNLASFITQNWLNSLWLTKPKEDLLPTKLYTVLLICAVNMILVGGNIALCWGFAWVSGDVDRWTACTGAATPAYLHASSVMAGLVAFMALATACADYLSLRSKEKEVDRALQAQD